MAVASTSADATKNKNPLSVAIMDDEKFEEIERMVKTVADADVNSDEGGIMSPLLAACSRNNAQVVNLLLTYGADPNRISYGRYALHLACVQPSPKMCMLLLKAGANTKNIDDNKLTALGVACMFSSFQVIEELLKSGADLYAPDGMDVPPIMTLCNRSQEVISNVIRFAHVDPNYQFSDTTTLLIRACSHVNDGVVNVLLKAGANPNKAMDNGCTPLHTIANHSVNPENGIETAAFTKIIKGLLEAKGDIQLKTKDGRTAIDIAIQSHNTLALELFHAK
jgi:ankyrin repeat protein